VVQPIVRGKGFAVGHRSVFGKTHHDLRLGTVAFRRRRNAGCP
jgi:hypothetical protein